MLHVHLGNCLSHTQGEEYHLSHKRSWEEDYVLKQAFSALVPAFDPRPGRTNVPQIQDLEVPPPGRRTRTMRVVCMLLIPVIPHPACAGTLLPLDGLSFVFLRYRGPAGQRSYLHPTPFSARS